MNAPSPSASGRRPGRVRPFRAPILIRRSLLLTGLLSLLAGVKGCESHAQAERIPPLPPAATMVPDSLLRPRRLPPSDPFGYPSISVDKREVVELLRMGRHAELEALLRGLRDHTAADIRHEYNLRDAYYAFYHADTNLGRWLDGWVGARPGSAEARFARAQHYLARAWASRGTRRLEETSPEQVGGMLDHATRAEEEVAAGLALDPDNLVGYALLFGVLQFGGWSAEQGALLQRALGVFPTSYVLRSHAMQNMQPRWGGSLELMQRLAEEAADLADRNPRLRALRGYPYAEQARIHRQRKEFAEALHYYERALSHGEEGSFYLGRGQTYYYARDYPRALEDFRRAGYQRPQGPLMLEMTGKTLYWISLGVPPAIRGTALDRAIEAFELLHAIDPTDATAAEWLTRLRQRRTACAAEPVPCR